MPKKSSGKGRGQAAKPPMPKKPGRGQPAKVGRKIKPSPVYS